ncbi:hypothetical protein AB6A40_009470 [Gnathostoma spinigerum]|uniref:Uncharacterized protein n=1 Tax=Gnathostoma spinigerum TaxID=75299 RepID=A0ABD6ESD2_9BILA
MKKTGNESEMDPLLDTTQLPDFSRENAQNYRGDQRTGGNVRFTDRQEASISAFLREVSVYCSKMQSQMADRLLRNHPDVIRNLLSLLSYCTIAHDREVENITLTKWNQVSIADYALHILLLISKYADESMNDLLRLVIETVSRTAHPMVLSKPIAFAIVHMISTPVNQTRFARLGGHLLAARELERSLGALPGGMEDSYSFAPLLRHLASLSAQVSSGTSGWLAPKRPSEVKVDGLYNFAPICAISSTSGLAHQLRTLLAASPPHRRARAANWSYHFYSGEEWLDLTLTLPYQIMLHEVQIRPHAPALNTGPSAIQVELCPDPGFLTWTVLGPPATTTGFSKIRIPTISYPYPVHAVRIHIRKPPDSSNLGLSQIILAGMSTIHGMCISSTTSADMIHWLTILDKVSKLDDYSIWKYAPSLPQALVAFFLSHPLNADAYARISSLLLHLDERAKITTIVELILSHIISGNTVDGEALGWLADLLYSFCVGENERIKSATQSLVHLSHHMHVIRQRQLITGVASLLKKQGKIPKSYEVSVSPENA